MIDFYAPDTNPQPPSDRKTLTFDGTPLVDSPAVLDCPRCGGDNLHQHSVIVSERIAEDSDGKIHHVDHTTGRGPVVDTPASAFLGRRDQVEIEFSCENCHSAGALMLVIRQHKGFTLVYWA